MLRQLPPTITADKTPEWLPIGWIAHSTVLKRGRQTRTYTELRTGKKFSTKDQVLEYIKMVNVREEREFGVHRKKLKAFQDSEAARERDSWIQDDWKTEPRIGSFGDKHDTEEVLLHQNVMEWEASSDEEDETGCNQISYLIEEDEEDFLESEHIEDKASWENVENFSNISTTSLRSQPVRKQKLESRAKTQCVFEDEDMSSDSDNKLPEAVCSKGENASGEDNAVSNLFEPFKELNLHNVVVECEDKTREIQGLTGSFTIEINLDCEAASDRLVENDWNKSGTDGIGTRNIEIRDQESDFMHMGASSNVIEATQESRDPSEERSLKAQAEEETGIESQRLVFFPDRNAPSHSVIVYDNCNPTSSAEDLSKNIELCLDPQEKSISGSNKVKKNEKTCSSKDIKKKDSKAPTKRLQKGKTRPSIPKKGSLNVEPCLNFPFEPLESSFEIEDDSVISRYLEEYFGAAGIANSSLPLPDFGLPSFSDVKISLDEEPGSEKKKSPDPPGVQVASSS